MYWNSQEKVPCPDCGGQVTWTAWDGDCRGNDGGYIIDCAGCSRHFTPDEWRKIRAQGRRTRAPKDTANKR